jgi:hypothetical protein
MAVNDAFDILDITATSMDGGDVRVNLGDSITNEGAAAEEPWWTCADGFISHPNHADADGACQAFFMRDGNQRIAIAARDGRYASKCGELLPGDRAIVSSCAARVLLKAADSACTIYSENQKDNNSSMLNSVDGKNGQILMANGGASIQMLKDKIVLSVGASMIVLDQAGVHVYGGHFAANTKSGNFGVVGAIVPPTGVNSIVAGPSGMIGVPCPFWTIATT